MRENCFSRNIIISLLLAAQCILHFLKTSFPIKFIASFISFEIPHIIISIASPYNMIQPKGHPTHPLTQSSYILSKNLC